MAVKKSELYSSLWRGCDKLRGGMDTSQYKDYVLTLLFIKYISDKYAGKDGPIIIPKGASFQDMVSLKGKPDIGNQINTKIIRPIFSANGLEGKVELVDFNDDSKLGSAQEKVDLLSDLIAVFEDAALDFTNNRVEDDDILGDAYEYLMRNFATESGKSKGQFYTPAEVSRVMAQIIEIESASSPNFTIYDPTCGSGSLLLKVARQASVPVSLYGQEKDNSVKSLAIMNMWMHGYEGASIEKGNTLASPQLLENDTLQRFDRIVANPPFSMKSWSQGLDPVNDTYQRFLPYGIPPEKNGDYAFLLHILASLKNDGKAAVILPHGVLFRGNAEAEIRKNLIARKYIKGIIALPANLFFGTVIPASILVIDKEQAQNREGIFMMDASQGFIKDGNKSRLREQDIHKIVDVFNAHKEIDRYARLVSFREIEQNEFNLNIPRYVDAQEAEDIQDLTAHLQGGIPQRDLDNLAAYWEVYPNLKNELFQELRPGYSKLLPAIAQIKETIFSYPEFVAFRQEMDEVFIQWKNQHIKKLKGIHSETSPKKLIHEISERLLQLYRSKPLIDAYTTYQYLMDYWLEIMKDDTYIIIEEGWNAPIRDLKISKSEVQFVCDLVPKPLLVHRYFLTEWQAIQDLKARKENIENDFNNVIEENTGEEAIFDHLGNAKVSVAILRSKLAEYQAWAFEEHFPNMYKEYIDLEEKLHQHKAARLQLITSNTWRQYFENYASAKDNHVRREVKERVKALKKLLHASQSYKKEKAYLPLDSHLKDLAQRKGIPEPKEEELQLLADYLTLQDLDNQDRKHYRHTKEALFKLLSNKLSEDKKDLEEVRMLEDLIEKMTEMGQLKSHLKKANYQLDLAIVEKYAQLSPKEVQTLVVEDKWLATLQERIQTEIEAISQQLANRIKELAERYASTLAELDEDVHIYEAKVQAHLKIMGL